MMTLTQLYNKEKQLYAEREAYLAQVNFAIELIGLARSSLLSREASRNAYVEGGAMDQEKF